jgi:hypothetical protein
MTASTTRAKTGPRETSEPLVHILWINLLALDTGGGPLARLWSTALSGQVDSGYIRATGNSVVINLPKTVTLRTLHSPHAFDTM